jgi:hypothetical protein
MVLLPSGLLYISNEASISSIDLVNNNNVATVSGTEGSPGYTGDGAAASSATFRDVRGLAVDSSGNVYIADSSNHVIRSIDSNTGNIGTYSGEISKGDGLTASNAGLSKPQKIILDSVNNALFIVDNSGLQLRRIDLTTNIITTFAGTAALAISERTFSGTDGALGTTFKFGQIQAVVFDATNTLLYVGDYVSRVVVSINAATGETNWVAGSGTPGGSADGTTAKSYNMESIVSIAVDTQGTLYIAEKYRVLAVDTLGATSVLVGSGTTGNTDASGSSASFGEIKDIVLDPSTNNLYVYDSVNRALRTVNTVDGAVSTLVTGISAGNVVFDATRSYLYFTDPTSSVIRVLSVYNPTHIETIAGISGAAGITVDLV